MTGLYIHFPFCRKKCEYCDFTSFADQYDKAEGYVDLLSREMEEYRGEQVDTVYLGGGTPSSLKKEHIAVVMEHVQDVFCVDPRSEITMEVNPCTVDLEYLRSMRELGINRLSIGVQSLNDGELAALGRLHTGIQALECVDMAKQAGFDNISVDLMFGLPDQTFESFIETALTACSLDIQHISCYGLTIESGTPLHKKQLNGLLNLPGEDLERAMYEGGVETFTQHGFKMYEISNFARPGFQSRHNTKYWRLVPYIGLGVSASSCYRNTRYTNPDNFAEYEKMVEQGRNHAEAAELTQRDIQNEFMFLGLRMNEGVDMEEFKERFGKDIRDVYGKTIEWYTNLNLMKISGGRLRLTLRGMNVSNTILANIFI